ncbi:MAG TPA: Bpu10I family restriction endonuclease [Solirubrobacterales bacterium]|nr:Bpu10I family restriction endonuclease [Solirubrobacterales bacterium]
MTAPIPRKYGTPHGNKIAAAIANRKAIQQDKDLLGEIQEAYGRWVADLVATIPDESPEARVRRQAELLNDYKFFVEVDCVAKRGSPWLKRQKGQLKLDNSIIEEFLIHLVHPATLPGFNRLDELAVGPNQAFMSMSFRAGSLSGLLDKPEVVVKTKDQDFTLGARLHYAIGTSPDLSGATRGSFVLAVLAAECKVNLDKTMFQEASGTATRLKQGCPMAKYFLVAEFLDMTPEDVRLTDIDNVFLLRPSRRLGPQQRGNAEEVEKYHRENPIRADVIWRFVQEMQSFIDAVWYDPSSVLERGSFI